MRLLQIVGGSDFGGGSIVIESLAEMCITEGWITDVLTTNQIMAERLQSKGIRVVGLDAIHRPINIFQDSKGLSILSRFLRGNRYDLVHTHTSKAGIIGRRAALNARVPVVLHTVHGFAFHEHSSLLEIGIYSRIERLAARWCDRIITVSEFHRKWAIDLAVATADKIVAIPNGIDPLRVRQTQSREVVRASLDIAEDDFCIVTTGRLARDKGIEFLIAALCQLNNAKLTGFRAVVVGDGPLRIDLQKQVDHLGLRSKIFFVGFRPDTGNLLAAADLVVLPSIREGLSISLLEAMAAGKPIITTTIGGNKEVVRHNLEAILVPPKDSETLAVAIKKLVMDPEMRKTLAAAAKSRYEAAYTVLRMQEAYRQLYVEMASTKGICI